MLVFVVISIALAISAGYELIEWASALALGQGADAFSGHPGDPWDTQSDMGFALFGAAGALLAFSHLHDRQLMEIKTPRISPGFPGWVVNSGDSP